MGSVREVYVEGWGGSVHIGNVIPLFGTSRDAIWVRDLGAVGCNIGKIRGLTCSFTTAGYKEENEKAKVQVLVEVGIRQRAT